MLASHHEVYRDNCEGEHTMQPASWYCSIPSVWNFKNSAYTIVHPAADATAAVSLDQQGNTVRKENSVYTATIIPQWEQDTGLGVHTTHEMHIHNCKQRLNTVILTLTI